MPRTNNQRIVRYFTHGSFWLIAVLLLAMLLRFPSLSKGDAITDEVLYAFRAIGMMDFDEAEDQTTPLEWFDKKATNSETPIPWWTNLSFHDHPPLVFLLQYVSMKLFGETTFGFRLPSAIVGVASVYLMYLIGALLYSRTVGILSALLLGVTVNHVYISRIGLQEAMVIFFMLLASYFFLRSLGKDTYFIWTGVAVGLAVTTKYTAFILVPIFITYLLLFQREFFLNKKFWVGIFVAIMLFSPVLIYNVMLYQAVGHFDFQFSHIFGQSPEVWNIQPGKEIGSIADRAEAFIPRMYRSNSFLVVSLFLLTVAAFLASLFKNPKKTFQPHAFLAIATAFIIALIFFLYKLYDRFFYNKKKIAFILLGLFVVFELFYSINSHILPYPKGKVVWGYSAVSAEQYRWGFNRLADYLEKELEGKMPAQVFYMRYAFLESLHEKATSKALAKGLPRYSAVIVYDANINKMAQLWVLDRLNIYHGWPVVNTEQYIEYMIENGFDDIAGSGFEHYYFIRPKNVLLIKEEHRTLTGLQFEKELVSRGIEPVSIYNDRGEEAFLIYKF